MKTVDRLTSAQVGTRDEVRCIYCHVRVSNFRRNTPMKRTLDHLIPRSDGGGSQHSNVAIACNTCNGEKGAQWPGPFIVERKWPEEMKVAALDRVMSVMACKITGLWPEWARTNETHFGHWGSLVAGLRKTNGMPVVEPAKVIWLSTTEKHRQPDNAAANQRSVMASVKQIPEWLQASLKEYERLESVYSGGATVPERDAFDRAMLERLLVEHGVIEARGPLGSHLHGKVAVQLPAKEPPAQVPQSQPAAHAPPHAHDNSLEATIHGCTVRAPNAAAMLALLTAAVAGGILAVQAPPPKPLGPLDKLNEKQVGFLRLAWFSEEGISSDAVRDDLGLSSNAMSSFIRGLRDALGEGGVGEREALFYGIPGYQPPKIPTRWFVNQDRCRELGIDFEAQKAAGKSA